MADLESIVEQLRVIQRPDGGRDIVAVVEERPGGVIVLRHFLDQGVMETFVKPDPVTGFEVTVFYEGKLQIDLGAAVIMPERGRGRRTPTYLTYLGAQNAETSDESGGSA